MAKYDCNVGTTKAICIAVETINRVPMMEVRPNKANTRQRALWDLLGSCTMWHIWKARCNRVLGGRFVSPTKVVRDVWYEMVLTLKASYDNIKGNPDMVLSKKLAFHNIWKGSGLYTGTQARIQWNFLPPRWLFLPPIT